MVLEQAVLDVRPGRESEFELVLAEAQAIISSAAGFESLQLLRCVESRSRYLLLVRWERLARPLKPVWTRSLRSARVSAWMRAIVR